MESRKSMFLGVFAVLLMATPILSESRFRDYEKQTLDSLFDKIKYDKNIPPVGSFPNGTDGPVQVENNLYVRQIEYVCTRSQEWKIQITFRQQWTDQRLTWDDQGGRYRYLSLEDRELIWTPDTFIANSRSTQANVDIKPNAMIRITPSGRVLYSVRLTTTLNCPMNLEDYPFDTQTCALQLASYGYTTDDLAYKWKESDPVQMTKVMTVREFNLQSFDTNYCHSKTNTGDYSCLKVDFTFKRNVLYQWFAPAAVLTFISFISFWMSPNKTCRLKLLSITLVLLYLHFIYINHNSVSAGVHTAKDSWICMCFNFFLVTFIEYGLVWTVHKFGSKCKSDSNECKNGKCVQNCEAGDYVAQKPLVIGNGLDNHKGGEANKYSVNDVHKRCNYSQKWCQLSIAGRIDRVSAIIFPILFIGYIIVFFMYRIPKD